MTGSGSVTMTDAEREEFCAWCGKRRPLSELFPLPSHHEETRQWHCEHVRFPRALGGATDDQGCR